MTELGLAHSQCDWGTVCSREENAVHDCLVPAAEKGCAEAMAECARFYEGETNEGLAREWGEKAYASGDPFAKAQCLLYGLGVPKDPKQARALLKIAALAGQPRAQLLLGQLLADKAAKPSAAEVKAALQWFEKAAANGSCAAMLELAARVDSAGLAWLEKAATMGNAKAMLALYTGFKFGIAGTVERDLGKATFWALRAAEQVGDPALLEVASDLAMRFPEQIAAVKSRDNQECIEALHWICDRGMFPQFSEGASWAQVAAEAGDALGQLCMGRLEERKVPPDCARAAMWFEKSASQGYAVAQFDLAQCYWLGKGVVQNQPKAIELFRASAERGFAEAQCCVGMLQYYSGVGAIEWLARACEQGNATARCAMGYCYLLGQCVAKDDVAAVCWFEKAAAQRYVVGMFFLAICLKRGWGVAKDEKSAAEWLGLGAQAGDLGAKFYLGVCYIKGQGVERNETEGFRWMRAAFTLPFAQRCIAVCLMAGFACEKDEARALEWYQQSEQWSGCSGPADQLTELRRLARDPMRVLDECEAWAWARMPNSFG
jgi:TPR repeat protein